MKKENIIQESKNLSLSFLLQLAVISILMIIGETYLKPLPYALGIGMLISILIQMLSQIRFRKN